MPYAVTLPLDIPAAERIQRMWHTLAEQTGADDAIRLGYVPHLTFAVLPDTAPVIEIEEVVFRVAGHWAPLSVTLAGLGIFPGTPPVIWAAPVVTKSLLANHAMLLESLAPFTVHPQLRSGALGAARYAQPGGTVIICSCRRGHGFSMGWTDLHPP